jgi:hypothetical protein
MQISVVVRRTNTFVVRPFSAEDEQLLHDLLDASASLWNELTYERRQNFFDGGSVWDIDDYRKQYVGVLGSATAQQLIRKNPARSSVSFQCAGVIFDELWITTLTSSFRTYHGSRRSVYRYLIQSRIRERKTGGP